MQNSKRKIRLIAEVRSDLGLQTSDTARFLDSRLRGNDVVVAPSPSHVARQFAFCILLFAFAFASANAQQLRESEIPPPISDRPLPIRITNLNVEEGLSMSVGYAIFQDRYGFIWIGGQDGMNRFDGYDVKVYKPEPFDPESFPDGWVTDIVEDKDGILWVATYDGVARMNRVADTFTHYRHDPDNPQSLGSDETYGVYPNAEGQVWVSDKAGLDLLDPNSGEVEHYRHDAKDPTSISNDRVYSITEAAGATWFGTANGLNKLSPGGDAEFQRYLVDQNDAQPRGFIYNVFERPVEPGVFWLLAGDALVRFDPETGDINRYPYPFGLRPRGDDGYGRIVQDPVNRNVLWLGTDGEGLLRFDIRSEQFVAFKADRDNPTGLTSNAVETMYVDRSGTIWVGTEGSGVDRFNPSSAGVAHYRSTKGLNGMLPGAGVWGIAEAEDGTLWIATQDESSRHRVSHIDRETGKFQHFEHHANDPGSLGRGGYYRVMIDRSGTVWVTGLFDAGVNRYVPETNRFVHYKHVEGDATSIPNNDVHDLFQDRSGILWFGTTSGLSRMDRMTGKFKNYLVDDPGSGIPKMIEWMSEDQAGTLWLGSRHDGMARFDPVTGRAEHYKYDVSDTNSVSTDQVTAILERAKEPGIIWIGTGAGLNRLDVATGRFELFDESNGLVNNNIYALLEDDAGRLWMSTNRGLSRFTPETGEFRNYGLEIGLQALEFDQASAFRAPDGELFFGGINGLNAFYPNELSENSTPPQVAIVDLKLSNQSVSSSDALHLDAPLQATKELTLDYKHRDVSFDFVALHFENPEKNEYAYELEGFDKDWIMSGHRRTASYTNLPPGTYMFRVKAANSDGVWNEEGTALMITVEPPFWATWWFRIFAVLLFGGAVYGGFRFRVRQIAERNRALEDEVGKRTAELKESKDRLELTNEQLEQSHTIVEAINQETSFRRLLTKILEEARVIPGVERATALIRMPDDLFHVRAASGWDVAEMQHIRLTPKQAHQRYVEQAEEVGKNIFVAKNVADRAGTEELAEFGRVASFLILRVMVDGDVTAYLVFDNLTDPEAFDQRDVALLERLREHIQSAFIKTRILEDLQHTLDDLRTTQDRLVQSEKMASLGQLTAGIAHEIKNPLNFVNNFSDVTSEVATEMADELTKRRDEMPADLVADFEDMIESLKRNAQKIAEHGKRADAIVQNMLEHSKAGEGERHPTDLNDLLDEYLTLARHSVEARGDEFQVVLERHFDETVGKVDVVPQELGRVFMNLLGNAFDALREHGSPNGEPKVTVVTAKSNDWVEIRVSDNGPGIPPKVKAKIFEPFFTTKPTGSGTGLGLSMSYDIVTKGHGGTLDVVSEEGKGATFVVRLPV